MNTLRYHAHGKFLISAEYLVMEGVMGLAIPLKKGQSLEVKQGTQQQLLWISREQDGKPWFQALIHPGTGMVVEHDNAEVASVLEKILRAIPDDIRRSCFTGKIAEFKAETNRDYGIGTSSTLISLLAQWLKLNPYPIQDLSFGGSGYDIACATASGPIVYQKNKTSEPAVKQVVLPESLLNKMHFVYSGQKMNSRTAILHYQRKRSNPLLKEKIQSITLELVNNPTEEVWAKLLPKHEALLAEWLGLLPLNMRFPNIPFPIKSMGAWGGDFFLCIGSYHEVKNVLNKEGFSIIWRASEVAQF
jgi:mevalonate kinase